MEKFEEQEKYTPNIEQKSYTPFKNLYLQNVSMGKKFQKNKNNIYHLTTAKRQ